MKFNVGDLIRLDKIRRHPHTRHRHPLLRPHPHPHLLLHPHLHPHLRLAHHLINTYGIIISAEKHNEIFEKDSTDDDNVYVWLSQTEQKEYYFYEDEISATNNQYSAKESTKQQKGIGVS